MNSLINAQFPTSLLYAFCLYVCIFFLCATILVNKDVYISKIIERVVKIRLSVHLTSNNLVNPHQSAYYKRHSTETALLYVHDHLINAISSRKFSCLCLLDLSAAFDTIDHIILLTRLSAWFGIHGTALN